MGAILPTFEKVQPPPPELPELTEEAKQAELAAFNGECVDENKPGVDVCRKTQCLQEPGNVRVLVTSCAGCDVRRSTEFRV
jgi:hypothetical protein